MEQEEAAPHLLRGSLAGNSELLLLLRATDLGGKGGWGEAGLPGTTQASQTSSLGNPTREISSIVAETIPSLQTGDILGFPFLFPAPDSQFGQQRNQTQKQKGKRLHF